MMQRGVTESNRLLISIQTQSLHAPQIVLAASRSGSAAIARGHAREPSGHDDVGMELACPSLATPTGVILALVARTHFSAGGGQDCGAGGAGYAKKLSPERVA